MAVHEGTLAYVGYKHMDRKTMGLFILRLFRPRYRKDHISPQDAINRARNGSIYPYLSLSGNIWSGPWRDAITRHARSSPSAAATWMKRENRIDNNSKPTTQTANHPGPCQQVDCRYLSLSKRKLWPHSLRPRCSDTPYHPILLRDQAAWVRS